MKEKYNKPELESKPYAQFENVFAACTKNNAADCVANTIWPPAGPSYSSHQSLGGKP
ncbi:MAG TPA: hypothetical protein VN370_03725 [Desulfitobacteriaceae bacterium]|jgi:hypothetical protein|nr:hypothetical protein [Desulfitobacteriaceae bacterium]